MSKSVNGVKFGRCHKKSKPQDIVLARIVPSQDMGLAWCLLDI